jgi:glyoxalase family protein
MQPIQGIHHVTAFASDPQANVDFYHNLLGQRLVKTTINFDDPGKYHFYFADYTGSPGTLITFFPWPGAQRGLRGSGEIGAVSYGVPAASLGFWRDYLARQGVTVTDGGTRFGAPVLSFDDPNGMLLELIATEPPGPIQPWEAGPIPAEHTLRGFHGVTLWVARPEPTAALLTGVMGYTPTGEENNRWRFVGAGCLGPVVDVLVRRNLPRGMMGAGSVHHVAFRARDDAEQLEYRQTVSQTGLSVTPVRDRQYFQSIYFREPGGVLFEIATDGPGFAIDEPLDQLGTTLKLPPWLESERPKITRLLPPFHINPIQRDVSHV